MDAYMEQQPQIIEDFISYLTQRNYSLKTIKEYFLDLRMFFRYVKGIRQANIENINDISIKDIDIDFLRTISIQDANNFLVYLTRTGTQSSARARKISVLRSFFKYHTRNGNLKSNPMIELEYPRKVKTEPKYLTLTGSLDLLSAVTGKNQERDYCILMLFLNCGLRLSEICRLNVNSFRGNIMYVHGKGNKERAIPLSDACLNAINAYLPKRIEPTAKDPHALFTTQQHTRMSASTVERLVNKYLKIAGLDTERYSPHKLRHTAATLMYKNGADVRTLQNILGHESLATTMIYTHINDDNIKDAIECNPLSNICSDK